MLIGIDLDNTIICYDPVFRLIAAERGIELPKEISPKPALKAAVRSRPEGEWDWALIQGQAYGPRIFEAKPFPELITAIKELKRQGHRLLIISHKTTFPNAGEPHRLQEWARKWIAQNLGSLFDSRDVYLNESRAEKLACIQDFGCDVFIDDLRDILEDSQFPTKTTPLLFSPKHAAENGFSNWRELPNLIESITPPSKQVDRPTTPQAASKRTARIAQKDESSRKQLSGGRNNEVHKIAEPNGEIKIAKTYIQDANQGRDRHLRETAFLKYAQTLPDCPVPKLLESDPIDKQSVLEHIPGELASDNPQAEDWQQCLDFLQRLQANKATRAAKSLPRAAEAAMSPQEHLDLISPRRNRWLDAALGSSREGGWKKWILEHLEAVFQEFAKALICHSDFRTGMALEASIVSPSDFGLHNAIREPDGKLCFIDFEYAGWDDPAKTLSDFFLQPRANPPPSIFSEWDAAIQALLPDNEVLPFKKRLPLVRACCAIKWIYIILNNRLDPNTLLPKSEDAEAKSALDSLASRLDDLTTRLIPHCLST